MAYSLIKFGEVPNKLPAGFQFPAEGVAPVSSSEKKADAGGEGKTPALPADASAPLVAGEKCKWWVSTLGVLPRCWLSALLVVASLISM
jgi:hypothetical protein